MKIQETEYSNPTDHEHRLKTKGIIILTDNRPKQTHCKSLLPDFRQSAFKQTEVDPSEPLAQITLQNDEDQLLETLNRKLILLEQRIKRLQKCSQGDQAIGEEVSQQREKKCRRKFQEMDRNYNCPIEECGRIYGSETSLRHHLKIKHKTTQKEGKENIATNIREQTM